MKKIILSLSVLFSSLFAEVSVGSQLSALSLQGDTGGYVEKGMTWSSAMLHGKTTMLMYVDPDEKSKGEIFKPTIEAFERDLDFDKFQILVILNLKATWKPNTLINTLVKNKMKDYPKRIYVLDKESVLVKAWDLKDEAYNTLLIDEKAKVIYSHSGEWKKGEIKEIDTLIRKRVK